MTTTSKAAMPTAAIPVEIGLDVSGRLLEGIDRSFTGLDADAWYVLVDAEAKLNPALRRLVADAHTRRPDIDIFYGDEAFLSAAADSEPEFLLKPAFDRTQLLAHDYIGWPLVLRGRVLARLGPAAAAADDAFSYDLLLGALTAGIACERIPEVLSVRQGPVRRAAAESRLAALQRWLARSAPHLEVRPGRLPGTAQLRRGFDGRPHVSLVIPTRQSPCRLGTAPELGRPLIVNFLESLRKTAWPMDRLTVVIGDDEPLQQAYAGFVWPFAVERIVTTRAPGEPFNYARKMNRLWRAAPSEYLVLANDDLLVRNPDWLEAMLTFAMERDVGGVGARLLYPDDRIQHAGMAGGVLGGCTHVFVNTPSGMPTYGDWADVHREWSMVTGAVFATRKSVLEQIGGFDERLSLEFNDVDLCLRLRMLGYRIVYTPHAELTHLESASRENAKRPGEEVALFLERWRELLRDDPSYHPRLPRNSSMPTPMLLADPWFARTP